VSKAKDKPHIYWMNMGPWPVFVGFTTNEAAFKREMARICPGKEVPFIARATASATTHHFRDKDGGVCCVITMPPYTRTRTREQYAALLAHEAVHVVQEMCAELNDGEPLGREAEAYLVQQIVQETLQIAWDTGKVLRRAP
jgi:hypothetical protein